MVFFLNSKDNPPIQNCNPIVRLKWIIFDISKDHNNCIDFLHYVNRVRRCEDFIIQKYNLPFDQFILIARFRGFIFDISKDHCEDFLSYVNRRQTLWRLYFSKL